MVENDTPSSKRVQNSIQFTNKNTMSRNRSQQDIYKNFKSTEINSTIVTTSLSNISNSTKKSLSNKGSSSNFNL